MKNKFVLAISFVFLLIFTVACENQAENKQLTSKEKNEQQIELTISAAASLKDAMETLQSTYNNEHPNIKINFNFGSSGSLQQQISHGAPVDIFFSAAEDKFNKLIEEGKIDEQDSIDLLGNSLVLIIQKNNDSSISDITDLTKDEITQFSIGTPESVPAGKYSQEALEKMDIWSKVDSKVVFAKDVRQVLSYVETGNVSAGMVYKTDALVSDKVEIVATANPNSHTPIIYPVGLIKDSKNYEAANDFYQYLQSDKALKVFEEYGFTTQ
ncbi:molybdate ABC transporter substrate-binding protein [Bacillus niameyensis]|uniref:molybdate ABC transporter substrate-binding protein n=1 Tax=Bacillus niameyensis TaxID=1522308 RepID=UPI000780822E|nr:molybdate ABC transporter substrate-binding protein [Bacillus niameyensis]